MTLVTYLMLYRDALMLSVSITCPTVTIGHLIQYLQCIESGKIESTEIAVQIAWVFS